MFKTIVNLVVIALLTVQFVESKNVPTPESEEDLLEQYNRVCGGKWWIIVSPDRSKDATVIDDSNLANNNPYKTSTTPVVDSTSAETNPFRKAASEANPFRKLIEYKPASSDDKAEGAFVAVGDTCRISVAAALNLFKTFTPDIKSLDIDCTGLNESDLEIISKFVFKIGQKSLVKLKLINLQNFDILSDLSMFGTLEKIEHLDLESCTIESTIDLSSIVPNLISLELNNVNVNAQSLSDLSKLKLFELISMPQEFFYVQNQPIVAFNNVKLFRILVDKPIDIEVRLSFSLNNVELISIESINSNPDDRNKDLVNELCNDKPKLEKLILNIPDSFKIHELQEIAKDKPQLKEIRGVVQDNATTTDELLAFYTQFGQLNLMFKK